MKGNVFPYKEEVRGITFRYIDFIRFPDGHVLRSNRNMHIFFLFWAHFRNHFACCHKFPVLEFRSYFAYFPNLQEAVATSCKGLVTEWEVRDAFKQVGVNKSPGLDSLPNEVYLGPCIFVQILMDMFNYWFVQGTIPGSITKGMITLRKEGGRRSIQNNFYLVRDVLERLEDGTEDALINLNQA